MTTDIISTVIISLFLLILLAGFLFGLGRGFNKSLVRLLIVVAMLVATFFIVPIITEAVMTIDISGMGINISGKASPDNWAVRIPADYERFYHSQLSNGYGLNVPKALAGGMLMNGFSKQNPLVKKCNEAAEILRSSGPMTEEEANAAEKQGKLTQKFEYVS